MSNEEYFRAAFEALKPSDEELSEAHAIAVTARPEPEGMPEQKRVLADQGQYTENHQDSARLDAGQLNPTERPSIPLENQDASPSRQPQQAGMPTGRDIQAESSSQTEYDSENPVAEGTPVGEEELPEKDNPAANENTQTPGDDGSETPYNETAYLKVQVSAAGRALPVPLARVTVTRDEDGQELFHRVLETGANGQTPSIALPAPDRELSERPGPINPYAIYQVSVAAQGFYPQKNLPAQLFAGQMSIMSVQLVPLPSKPPAEVDQTANQQ